MSKDVDDKTSNWLSFAENETPEVKQPVKKTKSRKGINNRGEPTRSNNFGGRTREGAIVDPERSAAVTAKNLTDANPVITTHCLRTKNFIDSVFCVVNSKGLSLCVDYEDCEVRPDTRLTDRKKICPIPRQIYEETITELMRIFGDSYEIIEDSCRDFALHKAKIWRAQKVIAGTGGWDAEITASADTAMGRISYHMRNLQNRIEKFRNENGLNLASYQKVRLDKLMGDGAQMQIIQAVAARKDTKRLDYQPRAWELEAGKPDETVIDVEAKEIEKDNG